MARRSSSNVTIRHVAAEARVSVQTVSRVLRNLDTVNPDLQERVRAAVRELGYTPSLAARRLAGARSYLLLAINDRSLTMEGWRRRQGDDWVDQMLLGGITACDRHGYRLILELVDTRPDHIEDAVIAALAAIRPDGVILTPPHADNPLVTGILAARNVPFVRMGSRGDADTGAAVFCDEAAAAADAVTYLVDHGHRRIGFVAGDPEYAANSERASGYQQSLQRSGIAIDEALIHRGDFSSTFGSSATRHLLALVDPPTAILAGNDQLCLGVLSELASAGKRVPADISLMAFDDKPALATTTPPVTVIAQPVARMADLAAELLIGIASGTERGEHFIRVPHTLIHRDTVRGI